MQSSEFKRIQRLFNTKIYFGVGIYRSETLGLVIRHELNTNTGYTGQKFYLLPEFFCSCDQSCNDGSSKIFGEGTCINCLIRKAWTKYQAAHFKLIDYTMPCKLGCCLLRSNYKIMNPISSSSLQKSSKNLCCNSVCDGAKKARTFLNIYLESYLFAKQFLFSF